MRVPDVFLKAFQGKKVANICDVLEEPILITGLENINQGLLCGNVFTVKVPPGDNKSIYEGIERAKPSDVIVVSSDGRNELQRSLIGEIMCRIAAKKGIRGFIVDGGLRDREEIQKMKDFTVFGRGIHPKGPLRQEEGELNTPVSIHGITIHPNDLIIGDCDGLLVLRRKDLNEILKKVNEREVLEAKILDSIQKKEYSSKLLEEVKSLKENEYGETKREE